MQHFTIFVDDKPYDVAAHYQRLNCKFPATPTMSVAELIYAGAAGGAHDCLAIEFPPTEPMGDVWTLAKHATRALPLKDGQRFVTFPDGHY